VTLGGMLQKVAAPLPTSAVAGLYDAAQGQGFLALARIREKWGQTGLHQVGALVRAVPLLGPKLIATAGRPSGAFTSSKIRQRGRAARRIRAP
jgi:hypothetical protein